MKILILAANPWSSARLALDEEFRQIQQALSSAIERDSFELKFSPATRKADVSRQLLNYRPDMVHFCGHGETDGLIFSDDQGNSEHINQQALANLFKLFKDDIQCVVLNACYSESQATAISEFIPFVVGMSTAIGDIAAEKFSRGFYEALFAKRDIIDAYAFGCNAIERDEALASEKHTPILKQRTQKRPSAPFLSEQKADILITVEDEFKPFSETLSHHLGQQLSHRLAQADAVKIGWFEQSSQLAHAATVLIIGSNDYLEKKQAELEEIIAQKSTDCLFLIEAEACVRPTSLQGLLPYSFWSHDPSRGVCRLSENDPAYFLKIEQLAQDLSHKLLQLKNQQKFQAQRQTQKPKTSRSNPADEVLDAFVFINAAPEDHLLVQQLKRFLDYHQFDYALPLDPLSQLSPSEKRQDLENNLLSCDALFVIYGKTSQIWLREQLLLCKRMQRKRDEDFKIIAVHNQQDIVKANINIKFANMLVFNCPPDSIEKYLPRFMEALS
jgi:hypothetical protein